jgi:hypothetical protein
MRHLFLSLTAAAAMFAVPHAAQAQRYQSIDQRQANQLQRIDQGVRSGALNRAEASRLRAQFRSLVQLENRYRRNGLSVGERQDLNRRFDQLSRRIRVQKNDRQGRRY